MNLKFTTAQVEKILDGRLYSFRQDLADSVHTVGSPQPILSLTEYRITNDGLIRNDLVNPAYIVEDWDTVNNKFALPSEIDSPTYVVDMSFTFAPSVGSAGEMITRIYIDDTVPKLIKTARTNYTGTTAIDDVLMTWYLGEEAGFDAKNDGVYFTIEFSASGSLYDKSMSIFRT